MRGWLRMPAAMLAIGALLSPSAATQVIPADPAADDPIIVTGRALRTVRIDYATRGRRLTACRIAKSSGKRWVDIMMCRMVRDCIDRGLQDDALKACVDAHIATLEEAEIHIAAAPDGTLAPPSIALPVSEPLPAPTPTPTPLPPPTDRDIVVTGERTTPDIVITGVRTPIDVGYWLFTEDGMVTSSMGGGRFARGSRRLCLRTDALEATLLRMFNGGPPGPCGWRVRVDDGAISGERICTTRGGRETGRMTGRYTPSRMELEMRRDFRARRAAVEIEGAYRVIGRRVGRCG